MCGRNCRWSAKLEIFVVQLFMETLDDSCVCVGVHLLGVCQALRHTA